MPDTRDEAHRSLARTHTYDIIVRPYTRTHSPNTRMRVTDSHFHQAHMLMRVPQLTRHIQAAMRQWLACCR
jgi:hypothetical protein